MTVLLTIMLFLFSDLSEAQNIYEVYEYSPDEWLRLSTVERMKALNTSNNHVKNKTMYGDFNTDRDLYSRWGYDYYEMYDGYENYAFRGFTNYNVLESRRLKWAYSEFGDRLVKMNNFAAIWKDRFNDDGTSSSTGPYNYINHLSDEGSSFGNSDGVWVARESTDDWNVSFVGSQRLRVKLTPLTLSLPAMKGMKGDFQSANWEASIINSMVYESQKINDDANILMLRGGQLRRNFGILNLGATFVTNYTNQGNRKGGSSIKGSVTDFAPTPIYYLVRVLDDSPWDGNGPYVYNVRLRVNGKIREDIHPVVIKDDITREKNTAMIYKRSETSYIYNNAIYLKMNNYYRTPGNSDSNTPKYLDYLYWNDWIKGRNSKNIDSYFEIEAAKKYYSKIDFGAKKIQLNGTEYIVCLFDLSNLTENLNSVQAEVTVSNDYRIEVSEVYSTYGIKETNGEYQTAYQPSYWKTLALAEGNVKDESNIRTVSVDFGYEVGNIISGFDAGINYRGYRINGEFVRNTHYYMFSDGIAGKGFPVGLPTVNTERTGHRSSLSDDSWYLTFNKDWGYLGLGGEFFKMGKFYRPFMNSFFPPNSFESQNNTPRFSSIADNDDNDQYEDSGRDRDGVYPGQDIDNDGIPDTDKNQNGLPDYTETFFMFNSNPDEFTFGDDFNNNTVPDFRENDSKYDTPYDLDRKGHHAYIKYSPVEKFNFAIGTLRSSGDGIANRTYIDYFKFFTEREILNVGNIYGEYRYEIIRDDIYDSYSFRKRMHSENSVSSWTYRDITKFYLDYKDSRVNKFYTGMNIRPIPAVIFENTVRYEFNNKKSGWLYDNTHQNGGSLSTLAMANKFAYTKQWGGLTVSPGIKYLLYKKNRSEHDIPDDYYIQRIPLFMVRYKVSNQSGVTLGMQGFDGMEYMYRDFKNPRENYRQKNIMIQFENKSVYFGFTVYGEWGFRLEDFRLDDKDRKFENYKTTSFYVRIHFGNEY